MPHVLVKEICIMNAGGWERTLKLPAKYEICSRCNGRGTHVNPNVDGNGISAEEWHNEWDEESRENYMSGVYDVRCDAGCEGGKAIVFDFARMPKKLAERIQRKLSDDADYERVCRHERAMGY